MARRDDEGRTTPVKHGANWGCRGNVAKSEGGVSVGMVVAKARVEALVTSYPPNNDVGPSARVTPSSQSVPLHHSFMRISRPYHPSCQTGSLVEAEHQAIHHLVLVLGEYALADIGDQIVRCPDSA